MMALFRKSLFIYGVAMMAIFVSILAFFWLVVNRVYENDSGVCAEEGRVLGAEEHRQRFLRNLVQLKVNASNVYEEFSSNQVLRVGIINNSAELDFRKLLVGFFNNEQSFEDNFSIDAVTFLRGSNIVSDVKEPFFVVTYNLLQGGGATFTGSKSVGRVADLASIHNKYKPTFYQRFHGFGSHYYSVSYTYISVECCDNNMNHRSPSEYINRKNNAYLESLSSIDKGFASHTKIAAATNCGEILTEDGDNGVGAQVIKWIRL